MTVTTARPAAPPHAPLDPQTADLLGRLAGLLATAPTDPGMATARANAAAIFDAFEVPEPEACDVAQLVIPGAGGPIPARWYRCGAATPIPHPLVVFLHGGGWCLGDLDSYDRLVRSLCRRSQVPFLALDYRLAPEHPFPAALEDVAACLAWVADRAADLDTGKVLLMGDSAGGNLATVAAHRSIRGSAALRPAGLVLVYPVLDVGRPHAAYPSRLAYGDGRYLLTREAIDGTADLYTTGAIGRDHPEVSPLDLEDLSRLPPTSIVTAGYDPLCDEADAFAQRLHAAGVPVVQRCFADTIHAFVSFGSLTVAQTARDHLAMEVRRLLGLTHPPGCSGR